MLIKVTFRFFVRFILNPLLDSTGQVHAMLHSRIAKCRGDSRELPPPRSAPSMIPRRKHLKKQARVSSEPAITGSVGKDGCSGDCKDSESDLLTNLSVGCSDLLSELNISCSKNISWDSSKMKVDQKTVGTNYSSNDFSESLLRGLNICF